MAPRRHGVQVTLAQQDVVDALELHRATILGLEENRIAHFDTADVRSHRNHLGPVQTATDLGCGGNDDAATRATLTVDTTLTDQYSIVQELDGYRTIRPWTRIRQHSLGIVGSRQRRRPSILMAT